MIVCPYCGCEDGGKGETVFEVCQNCLDEYWQQEQERQSLMYDDIQPE